MVLVAESDPGVGAVGSIIVDGHEPGILDSCGVGIALDGMSRQAMRGQPVPELRRPEEVLLFSGCACLLKMEALRDVGLLDEDFFAYCEDTDLGLRLRWAGWGVVVAPGALVYHHYSMTGGKFSLTKVFWVERNHFWVVIKDFPWFLLWLLPITTAWRYVIQAYALFRGRSELGGFVQSNEVNPLAKTLAKACWEATKSVPKMLKKRRVLKGQRRLTNGEIWHLLKRFRLTSSEIIGVDEK
jgi:GT2 family glycosyltransferase